MAKKVNNKKGEKKMEETKVTEMVIGNKDVAWHKWGRKTTAKKATPEVKEVKAVKAVKGQPEVPEEKDEKGNIIQKFQPAVKAVEGVKGVKYKAAQPAQDATVEMYIKCSSEEVCREMIARMAAEGVEATHGAQVLFETIDKKKVPCAAFRASGANATVAAKVIRAAYRKAKDQKTTAGYYNAPGLKKLEAAAKAAKEKEAAEKKEAKAKADAEAKAKAKKDAAKADPKADTKAFDEAVKA